MKCFFLNYPKTPKSEIQKHLKEAIGTIFSNIFWLWHMLGGAAGQKGPRYENLPIWENVIKSLNMMGNDFQRTGYVVSNDLLTTGIF